MIEFQDANMHDFYTGDVDMSAEEWSRLADAEMSDDVRQPEEVNMEPVDDEEPEMVDGFGQEDPVVLHDEEVIDAIALPSSSDGPLVSTVQVEVNENVLPPISDTTLWPTTIPVTPSWDDNVDGLTRSHVSPREDDTQVVESAPEVISGDPPEPLIVGDDSPSEHIDPQPALSIETAREDGSCSPRQAENQVRLPSARTVTPPPAEQDEEPPELREVEPPAGDAAPPHVEHDEESSGLQEADPPTGDATPPESTLAQHEGDSEPQEGFTDEVAQTRAEEPEELVDESESDDVEPPPAIRVDFPSADVLFYLFKAPVYHLNDSQDVAEGNDEQLPILFQSRPSLCRGPLSELFNALRAEDGFSDHIGDFELLIACTDLDLVIGEDNRFTAELSLADLDILHASKQIDGPLKIELQLNPKRFITRYRSMMDRIHRDVEASDHDEYGDEHPEEAAADVTAEEQDSREHEPALVASEQSLGNVEPEQEEQSHFTQHEEEETNTDNPIVGEAGLTKVQPAVTDGNASGSDVSRAAPKESTEAATSSTSMSAVSGAHKGEGNSEQRGKGLSPRISTSRPVGESKLELESEFVEDDPDAVAHEDDVDPEGDSNDDADGIDEQEYYEDPHSGEESSSPSHSGKRNFQSFQRSDIDAADQAEGNSEALKDHKRARTDQSPEY